MNNYYDFMINDNGDIVFVTNDLKNKRINAKFYISSNKPLNIKFNIDRVSKTNKEQHMLNVLFNLEKIKNNKTIYSVSDTSYIAQQIKMRLKTSLGELPLRRTYGTELERYMHKDINDKTIQKGIEQIVLGAISDLLNDYSVKVFPYINKNNKYEQVMKIYIYSNNSLILDYDLR